MRSFTREEVVRVCTEHFGERVAHDLIEDKPVRDVDEFRRGSQEEFLPLFLKVLTHVGCRNEKAIRAWIYELTELIIANATEYPTYITDPKHISDEELVRFANILLPKVEMLRKQFVAKKLCHYDKDHVFFCYCDENDH
ncbi:MAG: hypothetical protein Q8R36_02635 [bacterium]|nr:hypothetical protein [bacterium]